MIPRWNRNDILWFLMFSLFLILISPPLVAADLKVEEVLSVKTGKGRDQIGNQFYGNLYIAPFKVYWGFAVTSKELIYIGDIMKNRVLGFSKDGKIQAIIKGIVPDPSLPFEPAGFCLDMEDNLYVHEISEQIMQVFSPNGRFLRQYGPNSDLFENQYRSVPVINMRCGQGTITLAYAIVRGGLQRPIFEDVYDMHFKRLESKTYKDGFDYWAEKGKEQAVLGYAQVFEDLSGHRYGYPIKYNRDPNPSFFPLGKYSPQGDLLLLMDGPWLTKNTRYKVYDECTLDDREKLQNHSWRRMKGREFMIVNWYISPSGIIYALLANNDYLKVLRISAYTK